MSHELLLNAVKNSQIDKVLDTLTQPFSSGDDTLNKMINTDYGFGLGFVEQEITAIPLHLAVYNNDLGMVKLLLQYGADPTVKDQFDRDALSIALNSLNIEPEKIEDKIGIIDQLCLYGAVLEEEELSRQTAAMVETLEYCPPAIIAMKQKMLERVLFEEFYLNLTNAINNDDIQTINALLAQNVFSANHPYKQDEILCSITLSAIRNQAHVYYGRPLFLAAMRKNPAALKTLHEEYHFPLDIKDRSGNTLLHCAVQYNCLATAEYLLAQGLNSEMPNKNQRKPLDFLRKKRRLPDTAIISEEPNIPAPMTLLFEQYKDGSIPSLKWIYAKTIATIPPSKDLEEDVSRLPEHLSDLLKLAMKIKPDPTRPGH